MIPLPSVAMLRLCGAIAAVVAVLGLGTFVHHRIYSQGWDARDAIAKQDERDAAAHYADEVRQAKDATATIKEAADRDAAAFQREREQHEKDISQHVAAALAGVERLRVPVAGCTVREGAAPASTAAGTGTSDGTPADLMPGTAASILRFAGDSAQLVRDYNKLLERFDTCRAIANAP
ncbi:MAG TPA: hypothetical protein VNB54_12945 [Alphaproteobacteria bacterium]|nr:hypothetical protein [Alphaproteobacteria bacterium]